MSNTTIKVTVEYETPKTTKFEALMKEYETAKKVADETVSYYKPLADIAETAKFEAIEEQLEIIKQYAKQISDITNKATFIQEWFGPWRFDVVYRPRETTFKFEIKYGGNPFIQSNSSFYTGGTNIVGNWEKWNCIEELEKAALQQLDTLIEKERKRGEAEIVRYNNIIKGENK